MRINVVVRILLICSFPWVCGCGAVKTGTVTGKVNFAGKPLAGGTITFQAPLKPGDSLIPYTYEIGEDGLFNAINLPYGEYQVGFSPKPSLNSDSAKIEKTAQGDRLANGGAATPLPAPPVKPATLPVTFNDPATSGVTFTLAAPMATQDFDLK